MWLDCLIIAAQVLAQAQSGDAVLVQYDLPGEPVVRQIEVAGQTLPLPTAGLVVWSEEERDRWAFVNNKSHWPPTAHHGLSDASRGGPDGRPDAFQPAMFTTLLEPMTGVGVVRGGGLLSPYEGASLLNPKLTIRRRAGDGELPAANAIVSKDGREMVRIPLAKNQTVVRWSETGDVPEELAGGLPPGQYVVRLEGAPDRITFTVADAAERDPVMRRLNELSGLLGSSVDPLYLQVALEQFTSASLARPPYLADALDLLENLPPENRSARIQRWRECLLSRLEDPGQLPQRTVEMNDATGIPAVDAIRELIASSQWQAGLAAADRLVADPAADHRVKGFAHLYRGLILSEASTGAEPDIASRHAFELALEELKSASLSDRCRLHGNLSVFWHNQAEEQLNNHALQIATGGPHPLLSALRSWLAAERHNQSAARLSQELGTSVDGAVLANRARLYALLADIADTLSDAKDRRESGKMLAQSARKAARQFAEQGLKQPSTNPFVPAVAMATRAHLSFRQGDYPACRGSAESARQQFLDKGCLAGVESMERLLGLVARKLSDAAMDRHQQVVHRDEALRHFLIAHHVAELLRERFPSGEAGRQRAGFFARRAYVYEQLVELFIARDEPLEALRYAELAKARGLQDMLAARGVGTPTQDETCQLQELLADWPEQVVAVEYFLGRQRAWLFVIDNGGVSVQAIHDDAGRPLETRTLVADIQQCLNDMRQQAVKMRYRLLAGEGFDASWQHQLHRFFRQLLPGDTLSSIAPAKTLIVVPHHVLHYFPFAALVTEVDEVPRSPGEMVQPRFLIDRPLDLCYAPSLATWGLLRRRSPADRKHASALAIEDLPGAPSLPGVAQDVAHLRQSFGDAVHSIHMGPSADRAAARQALAGSGLLLFATHGINVPENPLQSCLWLYPSAGDDGRLTALDIVQQDVRADVVVMSACYSGLADRSPLPGDDLFGLQRAFLQSGAGSVMSGLWDVYDGTNPELLREFFERWANGESAAAAWSSSQRAFLARLRSSQAAEPWLHPYFWAVYTLAGDDR